MPWRKNLRQPITQHHRTQEIPQYDFKDVIELIVFFGLLFQKRPNGGSDQGHDHEEQKQDVVVGGIATSQGEFGDVLF